MGIVYRAIDHRRGHVVALKVLPYAEPAAIYRFKQEFRALADLTHANLVTLYELVAEGQRWFFTMEFVEGVDFLTHVRPDLPSLERATPFDTSGAADGLSERWLDRLRQAVRQLGEGVVALHRAGILHRDIKPQNVRVTPLGRVVLLDFGLVAKLGTAGVHQSTEPHLLGTVAYMSPEQASALPLSPASDWYSVGVILYEALTGHLPFRGGHLQVLMDKQAIEPPPPRDLVPGTPDDLNQLCVDLLRRDPAARPSGDLVLRRLREQSAGQAGGAAPPFPARHGLLVGRERHLQNLTEAYRAMVERRTVIVRLCGQSGVGKSVLLQHFLDSLVEQGEAVVLAGRCYEQESVPYKAVDNLVDALARFLAHFPALEVQTILPRDVTSLTRVFPVLQRVAAVGKFRHPEDATNLWEVRRRAFASLRELLARLGDRRPLVLAVDDLQWGGADSAALISDLVQPPDPPTLLFLASFRNEDTAANTFLQGFIPAQVRVDPRIEVRDLVVEPLTGPEACDLAYALLKEEGPACRARAEAIARESGGLPMFVQELALHEDAEGESSRRPDQAGTFSLEDVLWRRVSQLPEPARRLLEVVAMAGRPVALSLAGPAARLGGDGLAAATALRKQRLLRSVGAADDLELVTYHDRIRETVVTHLSPGAVCDHHRSLARVLEASGRADPEVLAFHLLGANEAERAGTYYALAGDRAAEALAFDRAATLYRLALELGRADTEAACRLRARLADALANAGRGLEAAKEYQAASSLGQEPLENQLRAGVQYLISGRIAEALEALRGVLGAAGLAIPTTRRRTLWAFLARRAQLWIRGLRFRARGAAQVSDDELNRIDLSWWIAWGLGCIDPLMGAYFQTRNLLLALRCGEPSRIARALALGAGHAAMLGRSGQAETVRLLGLAEDLTRAVDDPYCQAVVSICRAAESYGAGRLGEALSRYDKGSEVFRQRCINRVWERDVSDGFALCTLTFMGHLKELARRCPGNLKEARSRGDLYHATILSTFVMPWVLLGEDDHRAAEAEWARGMAEWKGSGYYIQNHFALMGRLAIHFYRGEGQAAWEAVQGQWRPNERSLLTRLQRCRIDLLQSRARSALLLARNSPDRRRWLRLAERDARKLEREDADWSPAFAWLVRGGVALIRGDAPAAAKLLADAEARFEATEMYLLAAAIRRRRAELIGGDRGLELSHQADEWMAAQGIKNPARMAAMIVPSLES
jgi:hypothetical protein